MAICRACACYMSHKTVGLAKPCKHTAHGRHARLRRFMDGRHPEPGIKDMYIENVVHFRSGEFNLYCSGTARGSGEPPIDEEIQQTATAGPAATAADAADARASADTQQQAADEEDWKFAAPLDPALMEAEPQPRDEHAGDEDCGLFDDDEGMGLPAYY